MFIKIFKYHCINTRVKLNDFDDFYMSLMVNLIISQIPIDISLSSEIFEQYSIRYIDKIRTL